VWLDSMLVTNQARTLSAWGIPAMYAAAAIALLLAAPVLVPYLHFSREFGKEFQPGFTFAQPFAYVPLNLVMNWTAGLKR